MVAAVCPGLRDSLPAHPMPHPHAPCPIPHPHDRYSAGLSDAAFMLMQSTVFAYVHTFDFQDPRNRALLQLCSQAMDAAVTSPPPCCGSPSLTVPLFFPTTQSVCVSHHANLCGFNVSVLSSQSNTLLQFVPWTFLRISCDGAMCPRWLPPPPPSSSAGCLSHRQQHVRLCHGARLLRQGGQGGCLLADACAPAQQTWY